MAAIAKVHLLRLKVSVPSQRLAMPELRLWYAFMSESADSASTGYLQLQAESCWLRCIISGSVMLGSSSGRAASESPSSEVAIAGMVYLSEHKHVLITFTRKELVKAVFDADKD